MSEFITLFIPFIGTALGSAMVFLLRNKISGRSEKILLGFAAGVMVAASVWSLLIPAISMSEAQNKIGWVPATVGFLAGVAFLLILDEVIPHLHAYADAPEGIKTNKVSKNAKMFFAVTLHNIPEGMAVGVAFAGAMASGSGITATAALALSIGIAIQNFPEGAIISMPLRGEGLSRSKAFLFGALSGAVEPLAGFITILFVSKLTGILPYLLAFAAGAMLYVVVDELIPESQEGKHSNMAIVAFALGFAVMMILDVALG